MAISTSSAAQTFAPGGGPDNDSVSQSIPSFGQPDVNRLNQGQSGFSGFVYEVRDAVQSKAAAPLPRLPSERRRSEQPASLNSPDASYESSIPIRVGQGSSAGGTEQVFLGVSVKQIVKEIPPTGPIVGARPTTAEKSRAAPGKVIGSAGGGGGSSRGSGNWLTGGFLSSAGSGGSGGFGFDLRPMDFSADLSDPTYRGPGRTEEEVSKSLKKLRRIVLDLVFNPIVYFGFLVLSVLMFMARFRAS